MRYRNDIGAICLTLGNDNLYQPRAGSPTDVRIMDAWGFRYIFQMTWHKPGGFQPVGLPQFNSELILCGRKGTPHFLDTMAFPLCFDAPRGAHSEKPQEFYDLIARVTYGKRIDMFARQKRPGFEAWGNEVDKLCCEAYDFRDEKEFENAAGGGYPQAAAEIAEMGRRHNPVSAVPAERESKPSELARNFCTPTGNAIETVVEPRRSEQRHPLVHPDEIYRPSRPWPWFLSAAEADKLKRGIASWPCCFPGARTRASASESIRNRRRESGCRLPSEGKAGRAR
jgi:hypothetical protein